VICSERSEALREDMGATAPPEARILVVEQSGPWGRDAVSESGLRPIAAELTAHAARHGARIQVVRRQTRRYACERPHAWLAHVGGALERLEVDAPRDLLELALEPGAGIVEDGPLVLACTHSTRDPCCARRGLPLHRALTAAGARTWHSSHLGGHRFAATMAVLPVGVWLGRVPATAAGELLAELAAGRLPLDRMRGLAGRPPAVQAAELHVRRALGLAAIADVEARADGDVVRLRTPRGEVLAHVQHEPTGTVRPLSCGEGAKVEDPGRWRVTVPTLES
jgi:sucrase/ferredoxin-like protein